MHFPLNKKKKIGQTLCTNPIFGNLGTLPCTRTLQHNQEIVEQERLINK